MKKILFALSILAAFFLGFGFKTLTDTSWKSDKDLKRVTGIGGIFFKVKDPKALRQRYSDHLGLSVNDYGSVFEWYQGADNSKKGFTQWSSFNEKTKYFNHQKKNLWLIIVYKILKN